MWDGGERAYVHGLINHYKQFFENLNITKAVKFATLPAAGFSIENSAVGAELW